MSMDETNELLRQIWTHMVAMGKALNAKVDDVKQDVATLSARIDGVETKLGTRMDRLDARMQRGFERIELRLVVIDGRLDDLEERMERVEVHLGFTQPKPAT